ncbi:amidohydrolase family protein [Kineobactrum salinum]|uniref:Amidohydrolase family protein n=1 Tax=Kineobactrum salinum TaxID=2708301 RepID=A0A6C0U3M7_9GAMM|nr:amidohydrolase family protein [Kineobactrum salinum]QIB66772.1 amidohydrolase family protein [Kineobactrum salinum]
MRNIFAWRPAPGTGTRLSVFAAILLSLSARAGAADQLFTNGKVYTQDPQQPWVEAFVVRDGKYLFAGSEARARELLRQGHAETDLENRFVMPALIDAHLHPVRGGTSNLYECQFPFSAGPADVQDAIARCVADNPDAVWILGDSGTAVSLSASIYPHRGVFLTRCLATRR